MQHFPLDSSKADVAAAEAVGPANAIDGAISARAGLADRCAERADIEHPAAIGEDLSAFHLRAGVKDFDALDLSRSLESFDERSLGRRTRIALGRHHHGQGGVRIPA